MSVPILTFFNNKSGVGKTSLVYHLSWMFAELDKKVLAMDLDPQANLTAALLDEDKLIDLWENNKGYQTIYRCVQPLTAVGDLQIPELTSIDDNLHLIPGDLALAGFEETLSNEWHNSMGDSQLHRPFRILTSFWQIAQLSAKEIDADLILADVGPNLGAINRSALIASDFVVIPLAADLFSLQGLKNLGPTLLLWRKLWEKRLENWVKPDFDLPKGNMLPIGYLVQQHSVRLDRPVQAYNRWVKLIPNVYRKHILHESEGEYTKENDPRCLATIKHYRSLMAMAQETRKPVFKLTSADGAFGSHAISVLDAFDDFAKLARKILKLMKID